MFKTDLSAIHPRRPIASWDNVDAMFGLMFKDKSGEQIHRNSHFDIDAPNLPIVLDDRTHLTWDLAPETSFGTNFHDLFSGEKNALIVGKAMTRSSSVCECCGTISSLYIHELWDRKMPDKKGEFGTLTLKGVIAVCDPCHLAFHPKAAKAMNSDPDYAYSRLRAIQGWSKEQTLNYFDDLLARQKESNNYYWALDFSESDIFKGEKMILSPHVRTHSENPRLICGELPTGQMTPVALIGLQYAHYSTPDEVIFNHTLSEALGYDQSAKEAKPLAD